MVTKLVTRLVKQTWLTGLVTCNPDQHGGAWLLSWRQFNRIIYIPRILQSSAKTSVKVGTITFEEFRPKLEAVAVFRPVVCGRQLHSVLSSGPSQLGGIKYNN